MQKIDVSINEFLEFRRYDILQNKGKISNKQEREKAEKEYEKFNRMQEIISDFDKQIKVLLEER